MDNKEKHYNIFEKTELDSKKSVSIKGNFYLPGELVETPNPNISLLEAIKTRRTVRFYSDKLVPYELFKELIRISMHSPTSCNEQKWKIIYIDDNNILNDLFLRGSAAFIKNAKQAFLVLYNNQVDNIEYRDDIQSGSAFINTFSLIAHSVGVGTCWIAHLPNKKELRKIFNIDKRYDVVAMVSFGFYRKKVKIIQRKKSVENIISKNVFSKENLIFDSKKSYYFTLLFRWVYYRIPPIFRRKLRKYSYPYEKKFYFEIYD